MRHDVARLALVVVVCAACAAPAHATAPTVQTRVAAGLAAAEADMYGNRYSAADGEYQELLNLAPDDATVHAAYALFLTYRLDFSSALQQARRAVRLDSASGECAAILTRALDWSGDIAAAATVAHTALRRAPRDPLVLLFASEATADNGDRTTAQREIDSAAAIVAQHPTAYLSAEVQREQANLDGDAGDIDAQIAALRRALALQPQWLYRTTEVVGVEVEAGQNAAARAALDAVSDTAPDDLETVEALGGEAISAGDGPAALRMWQRAAALAPADAAVLDNAGEVEVAVSRDVPQGVSDFERALAVDPHDAQAAAYITALADDVQHEASLGVTELHEAWLLEGAPETRLHGAPIVDTDSLRVAAQQQALADVNAARAQAGERPVVLDARLTASATSHAFYWLFNNFSPTVTGLGIHQETAGLPGYSGQWPWTRAPVFGYPSMRIAEDITHRDNPGDAVADWVNSVYHRFAILRPDLVAIGYAQAGIGPLLIDDMEFGFSVAVPAQPVLFPAAGQREVPTTFYDDELPDPVPAGDPRTTGYPVTVTFSEAERVSLQRFTVSGPAGAALPAYVLSPSAETQNSASLLPAAPLSAGTTYVAQITALIDGAPFERSWSFTTT